VTVLRWSDENRSFAQLPMNAFESHFQKRPRQFIGHLTSDTPEPVAVILFVRFGIQTDRVTTFASLVMRSVVSANKLTMFAAIGLASEKLATGHIHLLSPAAGLRWPSTGSCGDTGYIRIPRGPNRS
jgi:hypothetical protein